LLTVAVTPGRTSQQGKVLPLTLPGQKGGQHESWSILHSLGRNWAAKRGACVLPVSTQLLKMLLTTASHAEKLPPATAQRAQSIGM
jgi:hypothetical protein